MNASTGFAASTAARKRADGELQSLTLSAFRNEIDNLIVAEPFVVVEWRATGTNTGQFAGAEPTGLPFTRRGVGVAEVHDGRITAYRDYCDRATMLTQIGRMDLI